MIKESTYSIHKMSSVKTVKNKSMRHVTFFYLVKCFLFHLCTLYFNTIIYNTLYFMLFIALSYYWQVFCYC